MKKILMLFLIITAMGAYSDQEWKDYTEAEKFEICLYMLGGFRAAVHYLEILKIGMENKESQDYASLSFASWCLEMALPEKMTLDFAENLIDEMDKANQDKPLFDIFVTALLLELGRIHFFEE